MVNKADEFKEHAMSLLHTRARCRFCGQFVKKGIFNYSEHYNVCKVINKKLTRETLAEYMERVTSNPIKN